MSVMLGTDGFRYEVVDDWAKLPDGWKWDADVAAVGVDRHDNVYAFSRGAHPMIVFDRNGNFLRSWGEGVFHRPHGVHVAPDGTLFLTDDGDHTVRQCTLEGRVLLTLGIAGKPASYMSGEPFHRCTHTALSPQGDIYVSDGYGNSRVHKYSPDGRLLTSWGEPGTDPGHFNIRPQHLLRPRWLGLCRRPRKPPHPGVRRQRQVRGPVEQHAPPLRPLHGDRHPDAALLRRRDRAAAWGSISTCRIAARGSASIPIRANCWRGSALPMPGSSSGQFISPHGLAVDSRGDIYVGEVSFTNWGSRYPRAKASHPACAPCKSSPR